MIKSHFSDTDLSRCERHTKIFGIISANIAFIVKDVKGLAAVIKGLAVVIKGLAVVIKG